VSRKMILHRTPDTLIVEGGWPTNARGTCHSLRTAALPLLWLVALYFPTSYHGDISMGIGALQHLSVFLLLLLLWLPPGGRIGCRSTLNSLMIPITLAAATLVSPLQDLAYGALGVYGLLAIVLSTNLNDLGAGKWFLRAMVLADCINIALGAAVLLDFTPVKTLLVGYYSVFYSDLVPNMMKLGRPVLTFGTHSVAAFYYYIFFWMHFQAFKSSGTIRSSKAVLALVTAVAYLALCLSVFSVTSIAFGTVAIVQLLIGMGRHRSVLIKLIAASAIATATWALVQHRAEVAQSADLVQKRLDSNINGYRARYEADSPVIKDLEYIRSHPFSPVGVRYSPDLWFVDCGPVEYLLRGSIVLVACIYGGFWVFLRHNARQSRRSIALFVMFMAFEFGFNNLIDLRTIALLPCIVVFVNNIRRKRDAGRVKTSGVVLYRASAGRLKAGTMGGPDLYRCPR